MARPAVVAAVSVDPDPDLPLFVGGMVAAISLFAAGLTVFAAPGSLLDGALGGLAVAILGIGGFFLAVGVALSVVLRVLAG